MESFNRMMVFVAICIAVTDGRFLRREVEVNETYVSYYSPADEAKWACLTAIADNCIEPHLGHLHFETPESARVLLADRAQLEGITQATQVASACAHEEMEKSQCQETDQDEQMVQEIELVGSYLNETGHIDMLVALSQSPCFTEDSRLGQIEGAGLQCFMDLMGHVSAQGDVCEGLNTMKTCVINAANNVCGPAAGVFVDNTWDFVMENAANAMLAEIPIPGVQTCHQQANVVRRYARAAMDKLRK